MRVGVGLRFGVEDRVKFRDRDQILGLVSIWGSRSFGMQSGQISGLGSSIGRVWFRV